MIKTMVYCTTMGGKRLQYFSFRITSTIGWRSRERFFQPYQIWHLKKTENEEFDAIEEDQPDDVFSEANHLDTTELWIKSFIDIKRKAKSLEFNPIFKIIDGRRIFVTELPVDYVPTEEQREEVKELLCDLSLGANLDLPKDLFELATEYEEVNFGQYSQIQSPDQSLSGDSIFERNLQNMMEG